MSANLMSLARSGGKFLKLFGDRKMMKLLPYDAEVEYLESTGTQWIDTEIKPSEDLATYLTFSYQKITNNVTAFGSRSTLTSDDRYWVNYDKSFEIGYGKWYDFPKYTNVGVINTVAFNEIVNGDHTFTINGVTKTFSGKPNTTFNMIIFGRNVGSTSTLCNMRLYSMSMKQNGVLIRDFIPVRFTNERGETECALYDRVSCQLFRNAGTGAFVIGPDKTI